MENRHISSRYKISARSVKVPARHIDGVYERPLKVSTKKTKVVLKEKPVKSSSGAVKKNIETTATSQNQTMYQTTSPNGDSHIVHRVIHEYYQTNNQPVQQQVLYPQYATSAPRAVQPQNQRMQQAYAQPMMRPAMAGSAPMYTRPVSYVKPKKDTVLTKIGKKFKDNSTKKAKQDNGKLKPSDIVRYAVVTVFVVLAGYLAYDTWQTNQQLQNAVRGDSASASYDSSADVNNPPVANGEAYPEYKVAADHPRIIMIPSINVTARMTNVGLTSSSKIEVPSDSSYAGWYTGASVPGSYGAAFVTGHYNGVNAGGVFDNLGSVVAGDEISVEMGDGTVYKYEVVSSETVSVGQVDMAKALSVVDDEDEGLNIMTCAGAFTSGGFADRLTVYAKRV